MKSVGVLSNLENYGNILSGKQSCRIVVAHWYESIGINLW